MTRFPVAEYVPLRVFIVGSDGQCIFAEMSEAVQAALDVVADGGGPMEKWTPMLLAAEREGNDPIGFAKHLLRLREAASG